MLYFIFKLLASSPRELRLLVLIHNLFKSILSFFAFSVSNNCFLFTNFSLISEIFLFFSSNNLDNLEISFLLFSLIFFDFSNTLLNPINCLLFLFIMANFSFNSFNLFSISSNDRFLLIFSDSNLL